MRKSYRPYFQGKRCDLCKAPAKFFRKTKVRSYMLCDRPECNEVTLVACDYISRPVFPTEKK